MVLGSGRVSNLGSLGSILGSLGSILRSLGSNLGSLGSILVSLGSALGYALGSSLGSLYPPALGYVGVCLYDGPGLVYSSP